MVAHCRSLIERAGPACVAVKPQLACFERLGAPGWAALAEVCGEARAAGLLVIADGKRGDVPVTAAAYAQALVGETPTPWGPVPGLGVDAFTANPLLGADALEPLIEAAAATGAGVFALVRTSNPGAADVQDLAAPEQPLHERLAALVDRLAPRLPGAGEMSGMGAVVGATAPEHIGRLRSLMPRSIFLIPGVGAQGGRPELLGPAFSAWRTRITVEACAPRSDTQARMSATGRNERIPEATAPETTHLPDPFSGRGAPFGGSARRPWPPARRRPP